MSAIVFRSESGLNRLRPARCIDMAVVSRHSHIHNRQELSKRYLGTDTCVFQMLQIHCLVKCRDADMTVPKMPKQNTLRMLLGRKSQVSMFARHKGCLPHCTPDEPSLSHGAQSMSEKAMLSRHIGLCIKMLNMTTRTGLIQESSCCTTINTRGHESSNNNFGMAIDTVGVIGGGVIGASWTGLDWTGLFLSRGLKVLVADPAKGAEQSLRSYLQTTWPTLKELRMSFGASIDNYQFVGPSLKDFGDDFVQEVR